MQTSRLVTAHSIAHALIVLVVTNTSAAHPRSNSFYKTVNYNNTTSTIALFHGTQAIVIVPKLYGTDTVQASINWS